MTTFSAILALLLPWMAASVGLRCVLPVSAPGAWPISLGYGFYIGLFMTTLLMRLWDSLGLGLNPLPTLATWTVLGLFGTWYYWRNLAKKEHTLKLPVTDASINRVTIVLGTIFLTVILARLGTLALEIAWRPLFAWDAWTVWMLRAEVWAYHGTLVPFVDPERWLAGNPPGAYTIDAWHYPKTVSLIGTWMAVNAGLEQEGWRHLPWLLALVASALGLYGQVRWWGGSLIAGLVLAYIVISLPLLDTHVALAGYADIWVAGTLALGGSALWRWTWQREPGQGILALLMLLFLPLLKLEGNVWLLIFLPALVLTLISPRWIWAGCAALMLGAAVWWYLDGFTATLPGLGLVEMHPRRLFIENVFDISFRYEPTALTALSRGMFVYANWHLLWYAGIAAWLTGAVLSYRERVLWIPTLSQLVMVLLLAFLFLFTQAAEWAVLQTSSNRLMLHFAPLTAFYIWLVWHTFGENRLNP